MDVPLSSEPAQIQCTVSIWLPMKVQVVIFCLNLVDHPACTVCPGDPQIQKISVKEMLYFFVNEECSLKSVSSPAPVLKITRRSKPKSV